MTTFTRDIVLPLNKIDAFDNDTDSLEFDINPPIICSNNEQVTLQVVRIHGLRKERPLLTEYDNPLVFRIKWLSTEAVIGSPVIAELYYNDIAECPSPFILASLVQAQLDLYNYTYVYYEGTEEYLDHQFQYDASRKTYAFSAQPTSRPQTYEIQTFTEGIYGSANMIGYEGVMGAPLVYTNMSKNDTPTRRYIYSSVIHFTVSDTIFLRILSHHVKGMEYTSSNGTRVDDIVSVIQAPDDFTSTVDVSEYDPNSPYYGLGTNTVDKISFKFVYDILPLQHMPFYTGVIVLRFSSKPYTKSRDTTTMEDIDVTDDELDTYERIFREKMDAFINKLNKM